MTVKLDRDHWLETYRSLITLSIEGVKFSALANGGTAVALLAHVGNVAGKASPTPDMRVPMAAFLVGLCACGFTMLFAYLTQLRLLNEISRVESTRLTHGWPLWFAILMFTSSIAAFAVGSWQAVVRF